MCCNRALSVVVGSGDAMMVISGLGGVVVLGVAKW